MGTPRRILGQLLRLTVLPLLFVVSLVLHLPGVIGRSAVRDIARAAVADLAPGRRTTLSIRPERMLAGTADAPPPNAAPARVAELIYHGDHVRAHLVTTTGQALFAKVLSGTDPGWLAVGTEVRIGWHDRDCRALDARPDHLEPDHLEPAATAG